MEGAALAAEIGKASQHLFGWGGLLTGGPSKSVTLPSECGGSGEQREHWPPRSDLSRHVQTTFGSEEISHGFQACIHAPLSRWTRSPVTYERDRPGATAKGFDRGMGTCMILLIHAWPLSVAWKGLMSHDVTCHPLFQDNASRERQRLIAAICVLKKTLRGRTAAQGTVRRARRPVISCEATRGGKMSSRSFRLRDPCRRLQLGA